MKFKHLFYDNTVDFRKISKIRLVTSIVIGLLSAFFIYYVFYVFREGFRLMSYGFENAPNIVNSYNRSFYNLFFAFLSLIFGNSIFISFLFRKPQSFFASRNNKRQRILVDQTFLNGNFIYWFGKLAIIFVSCSFSMFDFQFLPDYYWVFILLILVMYLETWKTIMLVLGRKKYKWLLIHFLIISTLSFGLSKIDIVDYKSIDDIYLSEMPIYNYPDSFFDVEGDYLYKYPLLKVGLQLDENKNLIIRIEGKELIQLNEVGDLINSEKNAIREELIYRITVHISADRDLKLKHIKVFEAELYKHFQYKVWYQVNNTNLESKRFAIKGFSKRINKSALAFKVKSNIEPIPPSLFPPPMDFSKFKRVIKLEVDDVIKFDNKIIEERELIKAFQNEIDSTTLFEYHLNPETTYQKYITVLSAHNKAIRDLRQNNSIFDISYPSHYYDEEKREKLYRLRQEFPINIKETIK